jgi:hypothetical protein
MRYQWHRMRRPCPVNDLACTMHAVSMTPHAHSGCFKEKTEGRKSRDTVPLIRLKGIRTALRIWCFNSSKLENLVYIIDVQNIVFILQQWNFLTSCLYKLIALYYSMVSLFRLNFILLTCQMEAKRILFRMIFASVEKQMGTNFRFVSHLFRFVSYFFRFVLHLFRFVRI